MAATVKKKKHRFKRIYFISGEFSIKVVLGLKTCLDLEIK